MSEVSIAMRSATSGNFKHDAATTYRMKDKNLRCAVTFTVSCCSNNGRSLHIVFTGDVVCDMVVKTGILGINNNEV